MEKIYVSIAGLDEIDLKETVISCINNAKFPDRVRIGVCSQYQQYEKISLSNIKNVDIIEIDSNMVLGVGAPRMLSSMLCNDEKYFLQIDAHMIFSESWDEYLIACYESAKKINDKVILSGYAPAWFRDINNNIIKQDNNSKDLILTITNDKKIMQPIISHCKAESIFNVDSCILIEQKALSYHFIFSESNFVKDFLPDPFIIYNGDEATLSLRAFSRGYKFYSPDKPILWHLNKDVDNFYSNEKIRWQPLFRGIQKARSPREELVNITAYNRVKDIFLGKIIGYYGAESIESIDKYENFLGIKFIDAYK